jgi:uncharacterized protein (DUF2132 family)
VRCRGAHASSKISCADDFPTAVTTASGEQPRNPLHGITLETIIERLVELHGWQRLGQLIDIRCFTHEPSVKSSLRFLRKTPWAREKVEALYLRSVRDG